MIGADQNEVALIQAAGVPIADVDYVERHSALVGRIGQWFGVDVGEAQQCEAGAEQIEQGAAVGEENAGWPRPRPGVGV